MRIAIDVTSAVTQRAGVGRYTRDLVGALAKLPDAPELRPFYVAPRADYAPDVPLQVAALHRSVRWWRLALLSQQTIGRPVRGPWSDANVYHAPDIVYPNVGALPVVMTVHDLSFIIFPQYHTRLNGTYLRLATPLMLRRAQAVIAVSQATKRDLVERLGVPEHKVHVVYSGISEVFTQPPARPVVEEVRQRYGVPEPFLLSVGTLEPRKNLAGTLQAYRLLRERLGAVPPLVLVGSSGWGLDEGRLIGDLAGRVVRLGFVPDADLAALYASCSAFIYPSFYEGWGLPVAEALSLGAPTITSNISSLPEVAGDAALLVDPHSTEEIAGALERVLTNSAEAHRLHIISPHRARRFTVRTWATQTASVYDVVAPGGHPKGRG